MQTLWTDLRYGARILLKRPALSAIAIVALALSIGANTAIFSAINTLLLSPLPVKDIDRLVFSIALREGFDPFGSSFLDTPPTGIEITPLSAAVWPPNVPSICSG